MWENATSDKYTTGKPFDLRIQDACFELCWNEQLEWSAAEYGWRGI